jgi:hypothetical protein
MFSNPVFASFTGSQVIVPVGTRAFSFNVVSGTAFVNGSLYVAGQALSWAAPDSKVILGQPIAIGTTGSLNRVTVFYST